MMTLPIEKQGFTEALQAAAREVEEVLDAVLPQPTGLQGRVQDAMRYAVFAGGKRLRPFLVLQTAALFGVPKGRALRVAAAVEVLHTYSLVHDDLPAMDDDDLRRGRPTTHKQFDEATAILAGDALLTLAFEILADPQTHPSGAVRAALVTDLARHSGSNGMIGGQMIDIEAPNHDFSLEQVADLQRRKTGALFEFSSQAGARLAEAPDADWERLGDYARDLGLAFQIADDLIDVLGTAEAAGKAVGKDQAMGKATFVSLYGVERATAEAERLAERASQTVADYGPAAHLLGGLPLFLIGREG
jgi:farnesyl diphosphate synthase